MSIAIVIVIVIVTVIVTVIVKVIVTVIVTVMVIVIGSLPPFRGWPIEFGKSIDLISADVKRTIKSKLTAHTNPTAKHSPIRPTSLLALRLDIA